MRGASRKSFRRRSAAAAVEFAVVASITMVLTLGLTIGALGVSRYQQIAYLAREASRWASVHGATYCSENGVNTITADDVYSKCIVPAAVGLNMNKLSYSIVGYDGNSFGSTNNATSRTVTQNNQTKTISNTVKVTITYQWVPEGIVSSGTFSSTSECVISY